MTKFNTSERCEAIFVFFYHIVLKYALKVLININILVVSFTKADQPNFTSIFSLEASFELRRNFGKCLKRCCDRIVYSSFRLILLANCCCFWLYCLLQSGCTANLDWKTIFVYVFRETDHFFIASHYPLHVLGIMPDIIKVLLRFWLICSSWTID